MEMNLYQMDSEYQDSVNSSAAAQYRETETDHSDHHKWEAGDSVDGCAARVRLMCSYGGKIEHRAHDNHFSYVGGDTHIMAVERNIKFPSMISKLSSFWGSSISFKYQLPDEDLDSLVSVTSDEDMENMMAEYDRLQKMDYRPSRLRIFVFANMIPDAGTSSQSNLGFETKQGAFMNNMQPGFLFGLEAGNGVKDDHGRSSGQRGSTYPAHDQMNSKDQNVYMVRELRHPEVHSAPNSPMIEHSSIDSTASAPARINTSGSPHGSDHQAEMGRNPGRGFEHNSHHQIHPSNSAPHDSRTVPETVTGKAADHKQERYPLEFSVVSSNSHINERAHQQHPQLQIPIQEFQKLQLRQPHDPNAWPVVENGNLNIVGRRIAASDPARPVNFSNPDMPYMQGHGHGHGQQGPSLSDYYMNDPGSQFFPQSYWQMHESHAGQQSQYHPVYFVHEGSPTLQPMIQPGTGGGGGRFYNPAGQRLTAPLHVYGPEAAPVSNPVTTVRAAAKGGLDHTDSYIEHSQIHPPVPCKGPYTPAPSGPVSGDARVVYSRATAPVPHLVHAEPAYSYENVGPYEASSGQIYSTQAPHVMDPP